LALALFAGACAEPPTKPPAAAGLRPGGRSGGPAFALVPGNGAIRGQLVGETSITIPDSGSAEAMQALVAPGAVSGPVLIEVTGSIVLENGTVPLTEAISPGVTMYYRSNGDLYSRFLSIAFFATQPGGGREYLEYSPASPSDSALIVDPEAASHGLTVIWVVGEEESLGMNAHDPGFGGSCAIMISWLCIAPPPFEPARVSSHPPRGAITIRVYEAELPAGGGLRVGLGLATDEMIPPRGLGEDYVRVEVCVMDSTGMRLPNREVRLTLSAEEGSAGHAHDGGKPAGDFDGAAEATVVTGSDGLAYVVYRAPPPSGPVRIRASSDGAGDSTVAVRVGVGGLVELAEGDGVVLVGATASHADSHWGTSGMVGALQSLGNQFFEEYGEPIEVNDMSLPLGGLFDIDANWRPPHDEHQVGTSTDLRTNDRSEAELRFIRLSWTRLGGSVHNEASHYHLRY
jgi:hypothetical protein